VLAIVHDISGNGCTLVDSRTFDSPDWLTEAQRNLLTPVPASGKVNLVFVKTGTCMAHAGLVFVCHQTDVRRAKPDTP
jgi:hypothetical protein